ncbi:hypothetical protein BDN71DRAFT_1506886 [Pleurotus eryngii]|uniref:Uncharacterized protein n=1 Tax=Pleurotus eryngii TaxID=5323 RepID=A0A9P6A118_PLEER|nr:hypothetical protein BDN71DRAFT_1506886 [Pleurotus eryngii]
MNSDSGSDSGSGSGSGSGSNISASSDARSTYDTLFLPTNQHTDQTSKQQTTILSKKLDFFCCFLDLYLHEKKAPTLPLSNLGNLSLPSLFPLLPTPTPPLLPSLIENPPLPALIVWRHPFSHLPSPSSPAPSSSPTPPPPSSTSSSSLRQTSSPHSPPRGSPPSPSTALAATAPPSHPSSSPRAPSTMPITLLGAAEFNLFIDPSCVSIRVAGQSPSQLITIWSDKLPSPTTFAPFSPVPAPAVVDKKTLTQQLLEQDTKEDDNMIADEVAAPTWMTPILDQFPVPSASSLLEHFTSPLSAFSSSSDSEAESLDSSLFPSCCSSRSSNLSLSTAATSVSAFSSKARPLSQLHLLKIKDVVMGSEMALKLERRLLRNPSHMARADSDEGIIASIHGWMEAINTKEAFQTQLKRMDSRMKREYADLFPDDIPLVHHLPDQVYHHFHLKDANKVVSHCEYTCPKKLRDVFKVLLEGHLAAGRMCPSDSEFASPAFLIPKADPSALPHWVNDYWALNENTIVD